MLHVSSRGHSCTLLLRSELRDRGYRIFSLEAHDDVTRLDHASASDTLAARFNGWNSLRLDRGFISAVAAAIDNIQPDIVHIDADRRVLTHTMISLLARAHLPVLVRRGAIGGLNVLHPGDWLCYFGRTRQRLLCSSDALLNAYARSAALSRLLPPARLEVLHHHVPDADSTLMHLPQARQALGVPAGSLVIGTICTLRPIKNIATVAASINELRAEFPAIRLVVIGNHGSDREAGRIKSLAGGDSVIFTGPRPQARDYLGAFDVFVSPTRSPGEGFGLAIAEAMLASRAIITSDVGAGPELLGATGLVAPALDVGAWRDALRRLLPDAPLRAAIGKAARIRALTKFGAGEVAEQLSSIYRRALLQWQS